MGADVPTLLTLITLEHDAKAYEAVTQLAKRAISLSPNAVVAHRLLGDALLMAKDTKGATGAYENALALSGDDGVNFPFMASQNCTHGGLAVESRRFTLLAKLTGMERCTDWMGDGCALFGPGHLEGGVVEALWGESADDSQLDRSRRVATMPLCIRY